MENIVLVRQAAGIGDIFFCQKIANFFATIKKVDRIVWPVKPEFLYVKEYLRNRWCIPTSYVSTEDDFPHKELYNSPQKTIIEAPEVTFLPLHGHDLLDSSVMKSKYKLAELEWDDWADDFVFTRNKEKENELFFKYLKLDADEKFVFVNHNFASPPDVQTRPFALNTGGMRQVNLEIVPGYTIFDWCMVLERAEHIVTVETSLNYLIEVLNIRATKLMMLSKWNPPDFHHIEGLFKRNWNYIK